MRLFIGALVLNFMVFFDVIEASGLRRLSTMPYQNDLEGIDHIGTSRLHTQSSSTFNNPPLLAQQALDLSGHVSYDPQSFYPQSHGYHSHPQESLPQEIHGYHPQHQESSHQESSLYENLSGYLDHLEGIDHLVPSRFSAQSSSTYDNAPLQAHHVLDSSGYPSYSPQFVQQQSHGLNFYPKEYLHQLSPEEVSDLVRRFNFVKGRIPNLKSYKWLLGSNNHRRSGESPDYSKHDNIDWLRGQKREFELELLYQAYMEQMHMVPNEVLQMPSMRDNRYKNWKTETVVQKNEMGQEEKSKKQKAIRIREPVSSQNNIEERVKGKSAGQTNVSGSRAKGKAAGPKNVSNSHDQHIQQSQHSEDDSDEFEPTLIEPHHSHFNPYLEFLPNDPNHRQNWNLPGGSGSG